MKVNGPSVILATIHTSSEASNSLLACEQESIMPAHLQPLGQYLIILLNHPIQILLIYLNS